MDRENTISTFEKIINVCKEDGCDFVDLSFENAEQILALLKEREAVKPKWYYGGTPFCGNCGHIFQKNNRQHIKEILLKCPKCGTAVKWK